MSLIQVQGTDSSNRLPSPGLSSNNPFRNRTTSPPNSLPQSPMRNTFNIPSPAPERPTSRNPFLDQSEKKDHTLISVRPTSPQKDTSNMTGRLSPTKPVLNGHAAELFNNLSLNNEISTNGDTTRQDLPPYSNGPARSGRSENVPPKTRFGASGHHPSHSNDEQYRMHHRTKPRQGTEELDIFADPPIEGRPRPRPRRNSDSSIASRLMNPEEERRRRERHRRDREARHRDSRHRPSTSGRSKKPNQRLDVIDSLDVTSIYGKGLFHHDGPFDACNPDRNRKGSRRAPMEAFAADSKNNVLGGSGPLNKELDIAQFHGRGAEEAFTDFSTSGTANPSVDTNSFEPFAGPNAPGLRRAGTLQGVDRTSNFNPLSKGNHVHGEESLGLGTTTFLEGAPAARAAIQRRESETDHIPGNGAENGAGGAGGGLGRKRSLAQKIRGISNANRERGFRPAAGGRVTSPNEGTALHGNHSPAATAGEGVSSAGGMPKIQERNPFFNDFSGSSATAAGAGFEVHDTRKSPTTRKVEIVEEQQYHSKGEGTVGLNRKNSFTTGAAGSEEQFTARSRAVSSPKRGANGGGVLERRITHDGTGNSAIGLENNSGGGGGGFLSRVKSLKGGKRGRPGVA